MPRVARKISKTKVYHIILRGNDRQDIFFDEQDYKKFIKEIIRTKEKYKFDLYAYCLMNNHVHLLIYDKNDSLSKCMQSLEVSYSKYFCQKYEKTGHLFQNRFSSREVETERYLVNVCRYIHQNPAKAGMSTIENYKWSSYNEYLVKEKIINSKLICEILGKENFVDFHRNITEDVSGKEFLEYEIVEKMSDEQAKKYIQNILEIKDITKIKDLDIVERNKKIQKLNIIKGVSKAQIARLLGVNKKLVERIMKNGKEEKGDV